MHFTHNTHEDSKYRLYVIGNGFDLAHNLPTRYDPDFKEIAIRNEAGSHFWDLYQSENANIWSDFERLLAKPEFDELGAILEGYGPDYLSDRESDRTSIIIQADISGNLEKSLVEFATNAEEMLLLAKPRFLYRSLFKEESYYVTFNYTHTLENLYGIPKAQVLHIHGEAGDEHDLLLGYAEDEFDAGTMSEDVTGHGQYRVTPTSQHINRIEDYYVSAAYSSLLSKIQSWAKPLQLETLSTFLQETKIEEVVVIGFSFGKVDAPYFERIQRLHPSCRFLVTAHDEECARYYEEQIKNCYRIKRYTLELL